nr:transposase [Mediterraneibacter gnavus]
MNFITSVMMEGSFIISGLRKKKNRLVIHKHLRCMDAQIVVAVNIKQNVSIKYDAEKDAEKNKVMKVNGQWEALKEESHANIQSEKGILNRQIRSIQTEGHFWRYQKKMTVFRRFNYRTAEKVYKEFMLYAIGRNINKYHRFSS